MTTFEATPSLSKPMRISVRRATILIVVVLELLVSVVRVGGTYPGKASSAERVPQKRIGSAQEWTKVQSTKKVPIKKVYPLKSLDDLKEILFVGAEPYGLESFRSDWKRIFEYYNIQFLDRGTALLGISYTDQFEPETVEFTKDNGIVIASYSILHPMHANEHWSFADNYYKRLPQERKWRDLAGNIIDDPYEGGGSRDVFGEVLKRDDGRRIYMSLNSPNWSDYVLEALEHAIDNGINAINIDMMGAPPFRETGDFSDWAVRGFNQYLGTKFKSTELPELGITDVSRFDIRKYVTEQYVKKAVRTFTPSGGSKFFNMDSLYSPIEDPVIREFIKFNYHTLIDFHKKLSSRVKEYGSEKGMVIPYFGNLYIGGPSDILSNIPNTVVLAPIVDVIQHETGPAIPPKERAIIIYKIGWALSERKKPIWSKGFPGGSDRYISGVTQLYLAESYAAGAIPEIDLGGWRRKNNKGGWFVTGDGQTYPELKRYLDFVRNNQEYFKNVEPCSRIGIVYSVPSFMWRTFPLFGISYDELRRLFVGYSRALEEAHLQYDVLIFGMPGFYDDSKTLKELSSYDVLILPNVYSVTNEQLQALDSFVRNGRKLIYVGRDTLSRDDQYRQRDKASILQILGGKPTHVFFRDEKYVIGFHDNTYEKGIKYLANFNRLISAVNYRFEKLIETNAPREVGVNLLKQKDKLIIHFINYDYDLQSDSFRVKRGIEFKLGDKLPIKEIKKISVISPDFDETMYIEKPTGRSFVMPELRIWNTVVVE